MSFGFSYWLIFFIFKSTWCIVYYKEAKKNQVKYFSMAFTYFCHSMNLVYIEMFLSLSNWLNALLLSKEFLKTNYSMY